MLLNKFKMASLNDLLKRFNDVNERLAGHETRLTDAKAKLQEYDEEIGKQRKVIENATAQKELGEKALRVYKGEEQPEKPGEVIPKSVADAWETEIPKLEEMIKVAENKIQEQNLLKEGAASIKEEIEADQQEMDSIMTQFAADPIINEHLQGAIDIKYDGQVAIQDAKRKVLVEQRDNLVDGLMNDADLKNKVTNLKSLAGEYADMSSKLGASIVKNENKVKVSKTIKAIEASKEELRKAIESKYKIKLTDDDFEKIIETPEGEQYQIPSIDAKITKVDKVIGGIENRRSKAKESIKEAMNKKIDPAQRKQELKGLIENEDRLVENANQTSAKEAGIIEDLDKQIKELEKQFEIDTTAEENDFNAKEKAFKEAEQAEKTKTEEIDRLDSEIEKLDTQMSELMSEEEKTKLAELEGKIPADLLKRKNELTEKINDLEKEESEDIKREDIEELKKDPNYQTLWDNFKKADVALREAFVNCQTCQPEDLEDAKVKLADAIQKYKENSQALANASKFNVKQWHNYLLKVKNNMLVNGKDVEDVYFAENMQNKLDVIRNTYPDAFKEDGAAVTKFNNLKDTSQEIMDLQEKVLSGENVELGHITGKVDDYRNVMEGLFEKLKTKGFSSLESVKDLFGIISGKLKIQGKFNLFKWIGNLGRNLFGKGNKKTISGYKENTKVSEKTRKQKELKDVNEEIDEIFEEGELDELKALREKNEQYNSLKQQRDAKSEKRNAKAGELVGLTNKKTVAENAMKDAKKILEEAQNKAGKATPEQEEKLKSLRANKEQAKARQRTAEARKRAAEVRKRTYENEYNDAGLGKSADKINHDSKNEYREMRMEALDRYSDDEERE